MIDVQLDMDCVFDEDFEQAKFTNIRLRITWDEGDDELFRDYTAISDVFSVSCLRVAIAGLILRANALYNEDKAVALRRAFESELDFYHAFEYADSTRNEKHINVCLL